MSIGVENGYAGNCPGVRHGVTRLYNKIRPRCNRAKLLLDAEANKANVVSEMSKTCDSDLAIITFCGHGGQTSGSRGETDGKNELLCLYDRGMVDDEVWDIVSRAKGRVFTIFDCCHSGTMFCFNPWSDIRIASVSGNVDLLCWSSCGDSQFSYAAGGIGGLFTACVVRNIKAGLTYSKAWDKIVNDKSFSGRGSAMSTVLSPATGFSRRKLFS